jgi:broad specificity phosphatase PhoE
VLLPADFFMRTLYLIRHARPAVEGVLLGQSDPPLSDQGRRDARRAFSGLEVERVYSSPLRRARETAAFLRSPAEVTVLDELAEISLGAWDGKSWNEVERTDPALANRKSEDWFGVTPPDGESWSAFTKRVLEALLQVRNGPMPAAVVAHWAVNSLIAATLISAQSRQTKPSVPPCSTSKSGRTTVGQAVPPVGPILPHLFQQAYCEVIEFDL